MLLVLGTSLSILRADVLSVHPGNPRYFTDGSGRAIYLGGHQSFVDLQDISFNKEFIRNRERILDWDEYVKFMKTHNFNYLRNWLIWSTCKNKVVAEGLCNPSGSTESFGPAGEAAVLYLSSTTGS